VKTIEYGLLFGVVSGAVGAQLIRLGRKYDSTEASWLPVVPVGTAALA
jgi:hypothetical protein